jgi:DNA-binding MarR family transcriptional regulator
MPPSTSSHARLRRTLGFLLQDTSRLMRRRFIQRARETGLPLNRSEVSLLRHVKHEQGINQATLASYMDIEPVTVLRLIDRLEAEGLVERRPDPSDRRVWTVWLTEAAGPMLERIKAITLSVRKEALGGFSAQQAEALIESLVAVRENLIEALEDAPKKRAGGG